MNTEPFITDEQISNMRQGVWPNFTEYMSDMNKRAGELFMMKEQLRMLMGDTFTEWYQNTMSKTEGWTKSYFIKNPPAMDKDTK